MPSVPWSLLLLGAAAGFAACGPTPAAPFEANYGFVVERQNDEILRGVNSHVIERIFYHFAWRQTGDSVSGTLRVDSVSFSRDGRPGSVAPDRTPIATYGFTRGRNGHFTVDSVPAEAQQYPFLATVIVDLPAFRPFIPGGTCAEAAHWEDKAISPSVPVPSVDSLIVTMASQSKVDSVRNGRVYLTVEDSLYGTGKTNGRLALEHHEVIKAQWVAPEGCKGPITGMEHIMGTLIYHGDGPQRDTVQILGTRQTSQVP